MGVQCCRPQIPKEGKSSPENWQVFYGEREMGLGYNQISEVLTIFHPYTEVGYMSLDVLPQVLGELKIHNAKDCSNQLATKLKIDDNNVDYRAIFVACILLSRGKTSDKALILWRVFDPESKGLLSRSDSKAMFTVLCKAALDVFAESAAQYKGMSRDRITVWLNDLNERAKTFPDKLTEYFLEKDESISRTQYEEKLWKGYLGDIMLTFSIRRIIEHLEAPPKYSNPFRR